MLKKLAPLFLVILLAGVFLPLVSLASGRYKACNEVKEGKCVDAGREVCYEGIVPCGKGVVVCPDVGAADATGADQRNCWGCPLAKPNCSEGEKKCVGGVLTDGPMYCQLCHFFVMIDGIIDYVLIMIVPPLAILMLVIGGVMFYFGGAKPELLSTSKTLFKGVVIGLVLIYGAYMIVGLVLSVLGAADVNPVKDAFNSQTGVFKINCPISLPPPPAP